MAASHSRTVLSALPEAMRLPSGLNATLFTAPVWPVNGGPGVVAVTVDDERERCVASRTTPAIPSATAINAKATTAARRSRRNLRCANTSSLANSYFVFPLKGAARSVTLSRNVTALISHGASWLTST